MGLQSSDGKRPWYRRLRVRLLRLLAGRWGVIVNVRIAGDKLTGMDDRPLLLLNCALGGPDQQAWWGGPAEGEPEIWVGPKRGGGAAGRRRA